MPEETSNSPTPTEVARDEARKRVIADAINRFTYHPPRPDQLPRYEALRAKARELAADIVNMTPVSREQSLALTHLQLATMLANAAIACNEK